MPSVFNEAGACADKQKADGRETMRIITVICGAGLLALGMSVIQVAAEQAAQPAPAAGARVCSANSADRLQSCSVSCPEGKTATCVGGAQGAADVDCTCK